MIKTATPKNFEEQAKELLILIRKWRHLDDKLVINYIAKDLLQAFLDGKLDALKKHGK